MTTTTTELSPELLEATEMLAEQLLHAEPIILYHRAKACLDRDAEACELLTRFASARTDLRDRQSRNAVTQADVDLMRALQQEVQSNRIILEHAQAQQAAAAYLPEVNQEISQLLGIDFASLAGPGSC
jgi:cell fate (sporulation/competence/biofilm development) regulator YlbF (YheA/YmcA/DUF963 family)